MKKLHYCIFLLSIYLSVNITYSMEEGVILKKNEENELYQITEADIENLNIVIEQLNEEYYKALSLTSYQAKTDFIFRQISLLKASIFDKHNALSNLQISPQKLKYFYQNISVFDNFIKNDIKEINDKHFYTNKYTKYATPKETQNNINIKSFHINLFNTLLHELHHVSTGFHTILKGRRLMKIEYNLQSKQFSGYVKNDYNYLDLKSMEYFCINNFYSSLAGYIAEKTLYNLVDNDFKKILSPLSDHDLDKCHAMGDFNNIVATFDKIKSKYQEYKSQDAKKNIYDEDIWVKGYSVAYKIVKKYFHKNVLLSAIIMRIIYELNVCKNFTKEECLAHKNIDSTHHAMKYFKDLYFGSPDIKNVNNFEDNVEIPIFKENCIFTQNKEENNFYYQNKLEIINVALGQLTCWRGQGKQPESYLEYIQDYFIQLWNARNEKNIDINFPMHKSALCAYQKEMEEGEIAKYAICQKLLKHFNIPTDNTSQGFELDITLGNKLIDNKILKNINSFFKKK